MYTSEEDKTERDPMKELLEEIRKEEPNDDVICSLANELFISDGGGCNWPQMNEFERYAPCKIICIERDSFGWLVGGIVYNKKTFSYG